MRVVWWVFVCALLVLPSSSQQRSLDGSFPGVGDGEVVNVLMDESDMFEWTGLGSRASQVWFTPDASGSILELQDHHKHKSPPPPSPPPPSPSPPSPSPPPPSLPPPPPPLATLGTLEISNGAILVPAFDPDVHTYTTTVGGHVSEVRVTVSVPLDIQVYELMLNSSKLISGEESPPVPIGENGETVDLVITIVAPGHSSNSYSLSVHRSEKSSIWWKILKKVLIVMLVISVIAFLTFLCFSILRTSSWSFREINWWPFGRHQSGYQPVNADP